jgi:catechol 2,3-dioxygenase-like lactoylglutathione lyase family enzyme
MLDHVSLNVRNTRKSCTFFSKALGPLGYKLVMTYPGGAGFGIAGKPDFWIRKGKPTPGGSHIAFQTVARKKVAAFHAAALKAGGKDNGKPGIRAHYAPTYYAAFVFDPDGNNIEAVCHKSGR